MKFIKSTLIGVLITSFALTIVGCGSSSYKGDVSASYNSGAFYEEAFDYDMAESIGGSFIQAPSAAPAPMPEYYDKVNNSNTTNDKDIDTSSYLETQKLIYRCNISLESVEFASAQQTIKDLVNKYNGFIEYDSVSDNAYNWYYSSYNKTSGTLREDMTVRIPTVNYNNFVNGVSEVGKVLNKNENVENITKQYNDVETTIKSLRTQEERLLEMMAGCETVSDMIVVESRLSEVQSQLERYKTRLDGYDMDIQFSTITISLREVMEFTKEVKEISFTERFVDAVSDSFDEFCEFLQDLSIAIVYMLPYLILLIVFVIVIIKIIKTVVRKKKAKKLTKDLSQSKQQITETESVDADKNK